MVGWIFPSGTPAKHPAWLGKRTFVLDRIGFPKPGKQVADLGPCVFWDLAERPARDAGIRARPLREHPRSCALLGSAV